MANDIIQQRHDILKNFLERWPLEDIKKMTLQEYNSLDNKDSFCYWIEHKADSLGRIKGSYSSMFGIWQMKDIKPGTSVDFLDDGKYKWYKKYGNTADEAFNTIRQLVYNIAESASGGHFNLIDGIDYFSLVKWKIAFIYSNYRLFPVYKKTALRQIAKNFEFENYSNARLSHIHTFLVEQIPSDEDIFEFAFRQYFITEDGQKHNYYIIGSKYRNEHGQYYDISPQLYARNVIATGFFWDEDLEHLHGSSKKDCDKWFDKNLQKSYPDKFKTAKRALSFFLSIKEGDIIALKSHGQYGSLTIIAYAEVVKVNGKVYYHDKSGKLGHCINVNFLENDLNIDTGLSYGQTIHKIIPGQKVGHFEKIFGSYAFLENNISNEEEDEEDFELSETRINDKQTKSVKREVSYTTTVRNIHNKIQSAFAKHLQTKYPNDKIHTEYNYIDVVRQSDSELFYYEVKPYATAYNCIRAGIGQLLDYYHSNRNNKRNVNLFIVGSAELTDKDSEFLDFIIKSLRIPFNYISFNQC